MPPLTALRLLEVSPKLCECKKNLDQDQSLIWVSLCISISCRAQNWCEVFVEEVWGLDSVFF